MFRSIVAASFVLPAVMASYFVPLNEKDVNQCSEISLNVKGAAPFAIAVWPGCDEDADASEPLAKYTANSTTVTWTVNVKEGKSIMFGVTDANGNEDYTEDYTIGKSSDASCVGKAAAFTLPNAFKSLLNGTVPTTQSLAPSATAAIGNVGGNPDDAAPTQSAGPVGGGLGNGAFSSFSVRSEVAILAALGSIVALF